jgi:tRNA(Ile)-lysidine synthetase-like protein
MIRLIGKIPHRVTVACSGGVDSMAVVDFLLNGRRKVDIAYFNHDTAHAKEAEQFIKQYCGKNELNFVIGRVKGTRGKRSIEEFWRDERYKFLESLGSPFIITAHHLDDVLETWLMSSFHGTSKLIPYQRNNIYRPFLMTEKKHIIEYAHNKEVDWIEDPSNINNLNIMRNFVRQKIIPDVLRVNPGIRKTIRKKLIEKYRDI